MTAGTVQALPGQLRQHAAAVADRLATELLRPPPTETDGDRSPASPRWRRQSLSKGAAGVAILHGLRARSGLGPIEPVHAWLRAATLEPLSAGPGAGLWYGVTAIAFALAEAAPGQYGRERQVLDRAITDLIVIRLRQARARTGTGARPSLDEFDLVRGLTGLGAYLLQHRPGDPLLSEVLEYLVQLTEPRPGSNGLCASVPGWWSGDVPSGWAPGTATDGHANLGMAHGITGPLAFLSLAARAGVTVDRHLEAVDAITNWLEFWQQDGPEGPWWPERLTMTEVRAGVPLQAGARRPSWCYGTPGIARALQLAAIATGDHARQERAEHALAQCLSDPAQLAQLTDPAVCHGWAGVVATARLAAADARTGRLAELLPRLLRTLLDHPSITKDEQVGLIEGRAGIAAALHGVATGTDGWDRCLLIN